MKEKYEAIGIEVIEFGNEDVITTSIPGGGENELPFDPTEP